MNEDGGMPEGLADELNEKSRLRGCLYCTSGNCPNCVDDETDQEENHEIH